MVGLIEKGVTTAASDQETQTRLIRENSAVVKNVAEATDIVELNRQTQAIELPSLRDFY